MAQDTAKDFLHDLDTADSFLHDLDAQPAPVNGNGAAGFFQDPTTRAIPSGVNAGPAPFGTQGIGPDLPWLPESGADLAKAFPRGVLQGTSSALQGGHLALTSVLPGVKANTGEHFGADAALWTLGLEGEPKSKLEEMLQSLGSMGFPLLLASATGGGSTAVETGTMAGGFSAQGASHGYFTAIERGADHETALMNALGEGAVSGAGALALSPSVLGPMVKALSPIERATSGVSRSLVGAAVKGGTEAASIAALQEGLAGEVHKWLDIATPEEQQSFVRNVMRALAHGGPQNFLIGATLTGLARGIESGRRRASTEKPSPLSEEVPVEPTAQEPAGSTQAEPVQEVAPEAQSAAEAAPAKTPPAPEGPPQAQGRRATLERVFQGREPAWINAYEDLERRALASGPEQARAKSQLDAVWAQLPDAQAEELRALSKRRGREAGGRGAQVGKPTTRIQESGQIESPSAPSGAEPQTPLGPAIEELGGPRGPVRPSGMGTPPPPSGSSGGAPAPAYQPQVRLPDESFLERIQRRYQDNLNRVTKLGRVAAKRAGVKQLPDEQDTRLATDLRRGRTKAEQEAVEGTFTRPMMRVIGEAEIPTDEAADFLYASGASKRDQTLAVRSKGAVQGGSGWDPAAHGGQTAQQYARAALNGPKGAAFARLRTLNRFLNKKKLDALVAAEVISPAQRAQWVKDYGMDYVPAKTSESTDPFLEDELGPGVGRGLAVTTPEAIKARGRSTEADNPLAFQFSDVSRSLIRAEKNRAALHAVEFHKAHPEFDWKLDKAPTGLLERRNAMDDPLNLPVRIKGELHTLRLNDSLLARQLRSMGDVEVHNALQKLSKVSRVFTALYTVYDTDFLAANVIRDVQNAATQMGFEHGADAAAGAVKRMASREPYKAAWRVQRDPKAQGKYEDYYRELKAEGGLVSVYDVVDAKHDMPAMLKKLETLRAEEAPKNVSEQAMNGAKAVGRWWDAVTTSTEHGTRLAVYVEARERGLSKARSAQLAKNVTLNFELRGEAGSLLNALYPFFRVGASSTVRTVEYLATPRGRKMALGVALTGAALAELNRHVGGKDKNGTPLYDKIDPDRKERDQVLMIPPEIADAVDLPFIETDPSGARFIAIPRGQGFVATMLNAGDNLVAAAHNLHDPRQGKSLAQAVENTAGFALRSGDPLSGATPLQQITPWALDPIAETAENVTWSGNAQHPDLMPGETTPRSQRSFDNDAQWAKDAAAGVNKATGGSEYRPGQVDVYPAMIESFARQFTGGPGGFFERVQRLIETTRKGEAPKVRDIPIVRRFGGESGEGYEWREFNRVKREINTQWAELKGDAGAGDMVYLHKALQRAQDQLGDLRKSLQSATTDKERAKIKADRLELVREFVKLSHDAEYGEVRSK